MKVKHIDQLLVLLGRKTELPLDYYGFVEISDQIDGISEKYLYENLYREKEKAKKNGRELMRLQVSKLNILAKFIGFDNYRDFTEKLENPIPKILVELQGTYFSYVRRNDKDGVLLKSPVKIVQKEKEIWMELKGPKWYYSGVVELENECLFVQLRSSGGKILHHVYKIGKRERPDVIQGIFSGVSTALDPIGGRVVLIRSKKELPHMKNETLRVKDLLKSKSKEKRKLGEYFSTYQSNNLSLNKVVTFSIDDLGV